MEKVDCFLHFISRGNACCQQLCKTPWRYSIRCRAMHQALPGALVEKHFAQAAGDDLDLSLLQRHRVD